MAQMRRYGIPASVILAQGILESSNGQSRLALAENNHFGIKATPEWIAQGGRYGLYTDDKPNEKFCSYESVGESYEHHSRFLKENGRYARYFALAPDDYKGWTQGLEQAGYATGGRYADSLQRIIEQNASAWKRARSGKRRPRRSTLSRSNGRSSCSSLRPSGCGRTRKTGRSSRCTRG